MRRTGVVRKPLVLVVITSVILLLLSGCVLEPDYRGAVGLGPRVSVLGDSLFDASATAIHESLDATHRVRIGAVETRPIADLQVTASEHAATYPDVVVIQLGTFDAMSGAPASTAVAELDAMLAKFPSSCTVLVNINEQITASGFDLATAGAINQALAERAVQLVDWNWEVANAEPGLVTGEGILPSPEGATRLAEMVNVAVNGCVWVDVESPSEPIDLAPTGPVSSTTPTMSATYGHAWSDGHTAFTIWDAATNNVVATGDGTIVSPGQRSEWVVPEGVLQLGGTYRWGAANIDEYSYRSRSLATELVELVVAPAALTSPSEGDVIFGLRALRATIAGDVTPTQVDFVVDGVVVGTRTEAPWVITWDTTTATNGAHEIVARLLVDGITTDLEPVGVTVDNTVGVGERLELDHEQGEISTDEYALIGLDTAIWPATVTDPRYQSGGNDTPFWVYLSTWEDLTPATKDAVRQRFEFSTTPIAPGAPAPQVSGSFDGTTSADVADCPTTLDWALVITFGGGRPMCHVEIRHPDPSKNVPSLDFTFLVGDNEVDETDITGNSGATGPNGIPDYLDVMADNMFMAFLHYRDVLDLDVEAKFGPDHPIPVNVFDVDSAWVNPVGDHTITIDTRNHSTYVAWHEIAHVFQYNYLATFEFMSEFCPSDWCQASNLGFMEASADWAAHQVSETHPTLSNDNGYYQRLDNFLKEPWRQLTIDYGPRDWREQRAYGQFILFEWFQQQQQVPSDLMKRLYDGLHQPDDRTSIEVMRDVVNDAGSSFEQVLPAFWQAMYLLDDDVPGDDAATGLVRDFDGEPDINEWRSHLENNGLGSLTDRGRPWHQELELPMDKAEVSVNGQIEPGGAAFVDLEPADTMTGTAEAIVTVPQDRADKYRISALSWKGSKPNLCSTITTGGGTTGSTGATVGDVATGPGSGANPRQQRAAGSSRGQDVGVSSTTTLNGQTADLHITVPFTPGCRSATLVLTNIDPTDYHKTDDWSLKVKLDLIAASLKNLDTEIGVYPTAELNIPGVGLGLSHHNEDALYPGCLCEGWGVAEVTSGVWGGAYGSSGGDGEGASDGQGELTLLDFQQDAISITSRSGIGPESGGHHPLEVEHVFTRATRPGPFGSTFSVNNMFEVRVTITNTGAAVAHPRYRRLMDWDVPPDEFNEHVTIGQLGPVPGALLRTSNNGFETVNPLVEPTALGSGGGEGGSESGVEAPTTTFFDDVGPLDHGALFDFDFGELAPGASRSFVLYYGAADDEAEAMGYLSEVSAQLYSFGQTHDDPANPDFGPATGKPHTFIFAAKEL